MRTYKIESSGLPVGDELTIKDPDAPKKSPLNDPKKPKVEQFIHYDARSKCLNTTFLSCGFHTTHAFLDVPQAVFSYSPGPYDLDYDVQYDADRVLIDYIVLSTSGKPYTYLYCTKLVHFSSHTSQLTSQSPRI